MEPRTTELKNHRTAESRTTELKNHRTTEL